MCLRRCLSVGLTATLLACGVGVSGLESVSLNPPAQGEPVEAPTLDASAFDKGGDTVGKGLADATAPKHAGGGASSSDAGVPTDNPSPSWVDAAADSAGSFVDAQVVDLATVGCPDRAACPAGEVCCALFRDGGVVPAFDDAGALETSCRPSCTAGTTALCASNADCGDAGLCIKNASISSRGICAPTSPYYPPFPYGDGG